MHLSKCWCWVPPTRSDVLGVGWHLNGQTEQVIEVLEFSRLFLGQKKKSHFNTSLVLPVVGGKSQQALGPSPQ